MLEQNKYGNYVVSVRQVLFDVEVVKRYGLVKLDCGGDLGHVLGWKYDQYLRKDE